MRLKVTNGAKNQPELWIHEVIGGMYGGISPGDVREALEGIPDTQTVDVRINSDGGSFSDSITISSILTRRKGGYNAIVDGKAYSGGSVIAVGARHVSMQTGAWMMIHEGRGAIEDATADGLRQAAKRLDEINDQLVQVYKPRWKGSEKELRDALRAETWLRDTDAVAFGLADSVDGGMAVAAYVDPSRFGYKNTPEVVLHSKEEAERELLAQISSREADNPWLLAEITGEN